MDIECIIPKIGKFLVPMGIKVIAIGDASVIRKEVRENIYLEDGDVFVTGTKSEQDASQLMLRLKGCGIDVYMVPQYRKAISAPPSYKELSKIDSEDVYSWQKNGDTEFYTIHSKKMELCSLKGRSVDQILSIGPLNKAEFSCRGGIIGCLSGSGLRLYVGSKFQLLLDFRFKKNIKKFVFSPNEKHIGIVVDEEWRIYNISTGKKEYVGKYHEEDVLLEDGIFESKNKRFAGFEDSSKPEIKAPIYSVGNVEKFATSTDGRSKGFFINDKQGSRIVYSRRDEEDYMKKHVNIASVDFSIGDDYLYNIMKKSVGANRQYIVEQYRSNEISVVHLDYYPVKSAFSSGSFAVMNHVGEISFYLKKEKYKFLLETKIKRDTKSFFSVKGETLVVYNSSKDQLENYCDGRIRSIYKQEGCVGIEWSPYGLYYAALSYNTESTGSLQIFNCDGVLVYRKSFNGFSEFRWRPLNRPDAKEEKEMTEDLVELSDDDADTYMSAQDVQTFLSEWKVYLISKMKKES